MEETQELRTELKKLSPEERKPDRHKELSERVEQLEEKMKYYRLEHQKMVY